MRILILSFELPPLGGGGGKVVDGLSKELASLGYDIDIVTSRFDDLPAVESNGRISIWRVRCWRRRVDRSNVFELAAYLLPSFFRALRLIRRHRYDACHVHFMFPDGVIAWLLRALVNQPFVITAHGSDVPGYNPDRFKLLHRLLLPAWRRVALCADRIICPSAYLQSLVKSVDRRCSTIIIPNGFHPSRFSAEFGKKKQILCVTRLFERKGVQYLIEAVRELESQFDLHIVGDGPYRQELERLARGSRTPIQFHGWLDNGSPETKQLLDSSQIFVLASEAENFPVSLLEAMSAGLAIVTTSGTGCQDVVGDAAMLVPPRDSHRLGEALSELISDEAFRRELGERARQRLASRFSWNAVAQQHVALYRQFPSWRSARTLGPPAKGRFVPPIDPSEGISN